MMDINNDNNPFEVMNQKSFNSYKENLDLEFLCKFCMEQGVMKTFLRGEAFEYEGQPSKWIGYIRKGSFKYKVYNSIQRKEYITGFAFENEFVADYPNCLYGRNAEVTIEAAIASEVYIIDGKELLNIFKRNTDNTQIGREIAEVLFVQTYNNLLDQYRFDAHSRYVRLLNRCPQSIQLLSLKDIASYLNITPQMLSRIRKNITFND